MDEKKESRSLDVFDAKTSQFFLFSLSPSRHLFFANSLPVPLIVSLISRTTSQQEKKIKNYSRQRTSVKRPPKVPERHRKGAEPPRLGREAHAEPRLLDDEAGVDARVGSGGQAGEEQGAEEREEVSSSRHGFYFSRSLFSPTRTTTERKKKEKKVSE